MTATMTALPETTSHLCRLESGLVIPATAGTRTFVTQRDMFPGYFDEDFVGFGTDVPTGATAPTPSDLYEIISDGDFRDILGSFNIDPEPFFWRSQDQIITWLETHSRYLYSEGWATCFPLIVGEKRLFVDVDRNNCGLETHVRHFDCGIVWHAEHRSIVVLPQLGV